MKPPRSTIMSQSQPRARPHDQIQGSYLCTRIRAQATGKTITRPPLPMHSLVPGVDLLLTHDSSSMYH